MMLDSRDRITVVALLVMGLVFRLVYFLEYRSLLEFLHPTVDALYHHLTARAIAAGALVSSEPFFRAPLYNYFLGFIYYGTNDSIAAARFLQLMIGTATAPLVYWLARRMFDKRIALIAALLALFTGDILYFEGELVLEATAMWLTLSGLLLLANYIDNQKLSTLLFLGLCTGLVIIDRPNAAVLFPVVVWVVWRSSKVATNTGTIKRLISYTIVALLPIAVVLAHNATRQQPAFTIATQGGVNFFIGNNPEADGVSAVMPGKLGYSWQYADIQFLAEEEAGKTLSPSEVSSHYFKAGLSYITSQPLSWIGLLLKKTYLLFSGNDISNNRNLPAFKSEFKIMNVLRIGMWSLAPLGLLGIIMSRRRTLLTSAVAAFVLLYASSFILFFVNSRFRLPLLPLLAIFGAFALVELYEWVRERNLRALALPLLIVAALGVGLNVNLYGLQFDNRQQALFSKANLYLDEGNYPKAIDGYYQALAFPEPLRQVHLNLGIAYLKSGLLDSAWYHFLAEDSLFAGSAEALNNLSYMYRQTGQTEEAVVASEAALAEKPYLPEARLNYWYALREAGRPDSAYLEISALARRQKLGKDEKFIQAVTAIDLHHFGEADTLLRGILSELAVKNVPSYSEAASQQNGGLAPVLFESRVHYNLGLALAGAGEIDSAITYLFKAVEASPDMAEGWTNLGSAYYARKEFSSAIAALEKARRLTPESEIVLFNLALAQYADGNRERALEITTECLRLHPNFEPALRLRESLETTLK